jgi:hypothetical protein
VPEEAEPRPLDVHRELAAARRRKSREQAQERRLARAVRAGDGEEAAGVEREVEALEHTLRPEALRERLRADHVSASSACRSKNVATSSAVGGSRSSGKYSSSGSG